MAGKPLSELKAVTRPGYQSSQHSPEPARGLQSPASLGCCAGGQCAACCKLQRPAPPMPATHQRALSYCPSSSNNCRALTGPAGAGWQPRRGRQGHLSACLHACVDPVMHDTRAPQVSPHRRGLRNMTKYVRRVWNVAQCRFEACLYGWLSVSSRCGPIPFGPVLRQEQQGCLHADTAQLRTS